MKERNFSMHKYWMERVKNHKPLLVFEGRTIEEWKEWKEPALAKFMELLGDFPEKVALDAEVEYSIEEGDLIRERVVFNSERFMSVPCQILYPKNMRKDKSNPAIICSHGHGKYGKDPVAGIRSTDGHLKDIKNMNYNYAEQMAKEGFLTIAPDLRVFGERRDVYDSLEEKDQRRDPCNVNFIKGAILGVYTLTLNIWDIKCCLDYLERREEIDGDRIGMMGLSFGGTMTTFSAVAEPRIKAANIMGYINSWSAFGIDRANFCGSQIIPLIYKYFDTDDIAGLIAPRPLLVDMGISDGCFYIHDLLKGYEGVKEIYKAAGVEENLWIDLHSGGHAFGGNKAGEFFKKYL